MDIGIVGSGIVAQTLAAKLLELGNSVMISSRDTAQGKERPWGAVPSADDFVAAQRDLGRPAAAGSFAAAAAHGELVINATPGEHSVAALEAGAKDLGGKILVDVGNPLDYSTMPPTLLFCNTDSTRRAHPGRLPRGQSREDPQHRQRCRDGGAAPAQRDHDRLRRRQRPGGQETGSIASSSSAGSDGSTCSTSVTSPPLARWRCSCPSGAG